MGAKLDTVGVAGTGPTPAADHARDWEMIRAHHDIQFTPLELPKQPPAPGWLQRLIQWLADLLKPVAEALGVSWPVLQWILLGLAILLLAWLLWKLLAPALRLRFAKSEAEDEVSGWAPDRHAAQALLEDADRLAAEGRFDEATHLLLQRSVGHIALARPDWLEPSSTAREIAALPALPERARIAFSTIAGRVERSLFALRRLEAEDWQAARAAYADFALADLDAGAAG